MRCCCKPGSLECIGKDCSTLTPEQVAANGDKLTAEEKMKACRDCCKNMCSCCRVPANVECIGNECRVLTPEEANAELAKHRDLGSSVNVAGCNIPDNVVCIGNECRELSPQEADAERAKIEADKNFFLRKRAKAAAAAEAEAEAQAAQAVNRTSHLNEAWWTKF